MIGSCPSYTLNKVTELYCVHKFNDRRKYFKEYLILFQEEWKELFASTLFITKSVYQELKYDGIGNYIDVPLDCLRFLSVGVKTKHNFLKPLYFNPLLLNTPKPEKKSCSCTACNCASDGLCNTSNNLSVTTKEVVINGQTYTEYNWISLCKNGDVMEYREIPTTKYSFNYGSYDNSYDISYETGSSDTEVVTYKLTRKLCQLAVKPCGCPLPTPENEKMFYECCGCYINPITTVGKNCGVHWNRCSSWAGQCNISECGTKIYVRNLERFEENTELLLTYQINGVEIDGEVLVPNYANFALMAGVDYRRMVFNDRYKLAEKQMAFYEREKQRDALIVFLNPISIEDLKSLQTVSTWETNLPECFPNISGWYV